VEREEGREEGREAERGGDNYTPIPQSIWLQRSHMSSNDNARGTEAHPTTGRLGIQATPDTHHNRRCGTRNACRPKSHDDGKQQRLAMVDRCRRLFLFPSPPSSSLSPVHPYKAVDPHSNRGLILLHVAPCGKERHWQTPKRWMLHISTTSTK